MVHRVIADKPTLAAGVVAAVLAEHWRWNGSLALAVVLHATVIAALVVVARPADRPPPPITEVELTLIEPAETPPEPPPAPAAAKPTGPPLAPVPPAAAEPVPAAPPSPSPSVAAEPAPAKTPTSATTAPAPAPPVPTPPTAADRAPPSAPLAVTDNGFAITPGPMSLTPSPKPPARPRSDVFALYAPAAPDHPASSAPATARLAPLVIATGARHDPRLPAYPAEARYKGEQGNVLIEVELDPSGAIRRARLKQSSGHDSLDKAALRSARALRFKPPTAPPGVVLRNAIVVEIPFNFRLD